ncbi:glycosyltransferase [Actinomadura madurae]|nr:glycosyltransferase [Actinomadura madurae]URN07420.1 glycosyltransferase [Actinomadura madurae]
MAHPLVSVIVPVFDCRDTVGGALESVLAQTLPAEQVEVIAVDDGSTDGGGELLDGLARAHDRLTVVHQPNSGGAGAPRNRGLELASGTFVFFLDADDRLGPEALERMTAMAERNGTDIVLGKQVGTGGRRVPKVFDRTIERTHVLDPDCDLFPRMSMAALQLFRRSLVERAGLRFTEGLLSHEDQLFTAGAYLNAGGVSVLADYDCYLWAARADGTSSTQVGGASTADVHAIAHRAMALVAEHTEPGSCGSACTTATSSWRCSAGSNASTSTPPPKSARWPSPGAATCWTPGSPPASWPGTTRCAGCSPTACGTISSRSWRGSFGSTGTGSARPCCWRRGARTPGTPSSGTAPRAFRTRATRRHRG